MSDNRPATDNCSQYVHYRSTKRNYKQLQSINKQPSDAIYRPLQLLRTNTIISTRYRMHSNVNGKSKVAYQYKYTLTMYYYYYYCCCCYIYYT